MSLRRAPVRGLAAGAAVLPPRTAHYLGAVLRLGPGDRVELFDPDAGTRAEAVLAEEGGALVARVGELHAAPPSLCPATLIYAMAKGDKVDAVVRDAAELGAAAVHLVAASRSVARLDEGRAAERLARYRRVAEEAARQSGQARAPRIEGPAPLGEALAALPDGGARIVLHPAADAPLRALLEDAVARRADVTFAIGPEGGWTDGELGAMEAAGFVRARLAGGVLRTETAATAALAALRAFES